MVITNMYTCFSNKGVSEYADLITLLPRHIRNWPVSTSIYWVVCRPSKHEFKNGGEIYVLSPCGHRWMLEISNTKVGKRMLYVKSQSQNIKHV